MPAIKMLARRQEIADMRKLLAHLSDGEILSLPPPKYRPRNVTPKVAILLGAQLDAITGCWEWKKYRKFGRGAGRGYGLIGIGDRIEQAHRISYLEFVGSIPEGLVIDHRCGNQGCVNPGHLRAVTQQVNVLASNGLAARYAKATHCDRGHPFSGSNLVMLKEGKRRCRACSAMSIEERRASWVRKTRPICASTMPGEAG
jgi:hypothetical protein